MALTDIFNRKTKSVHRSTVILERTLSEWPYTHRSSAANLQLNKPHLDPSVELSRFPYVALPGIRPYLISCPIIFITFSHYCNLHHQSSKRQSVNQSVSHLVSQSVSQSISQILLSVSQSASQNLYRLPQCLYAD